MLRATRDGRDSARWIVVALAVAAVAPRARAESIGGDTPHPTPKNTPTVGKAPAPDPPRVALEINPVEEGGWVIRVANEDSIPVRIVEDWRLVWLEVTPPPPAKGKAILQRCVLPTDMRPTEDESHPLVLAPGKAYVNYVDPRIFCFTGAPSRALVPGATVVAHMGFPPDRKNPNSPPLFAVAFDPDELRSPAKEIVSDPFVVPEYPPPEVLEADGGAGGAGGPGAGASADAAPAPPSPTFPGPATPAERIAARGLTVTTSPRIDTENIRDLVVRVTLTNSSPRTVTLLLDPHTVSLDVTNHFGKTYTCQWEHPPTAIRDLFISIPPKGHASTDVLVQDLCPAWYMAFPGLYIVKASVDTRQISGASVGLQSFRGRVDAIDPTLVRVHSLMRGWIRGP